AECEARVRVDALRLANCTQPSSWLCAEPRRFDAGAEWDRLCRAGLRASCLDRGLLARDEAALRRACELGEPLRCTRAAGAALEHRGRAEARPWLERACKLGRAWACR